MIAIGGDLSVQTLCDAYQHGIFPWPVDETVLTWFSPPERAVLFFDEFHLPRSLARERRRHKFSFTIDKAFEHVIEHCSAAKNRLDSRGRPQRGTWITGEMKAAYKQLARAGFAHSVECWSGDALIGGLYGVSLGLMFAGESMFYLQPNASKLALCFLVDQLRARGVQWIDCQVMTPLFASFGARAIPRQEFLMLLAAAITSKLSAFPTSARAP